MLYTNTRNHGVEGSSTWLKFVLGLLAAVAVLLLPTILFAQTGTLTDDATFPTSFPLKSLTVQGSSATGGTATSFVKFKLTPNLPAGTPGSFVGKASLRVYVGNLTTAGSFNVCRVTSSWLETNTTAPSYDTANPILTGIQVSAADIFLTLDLTSLVQQWLGTDGLGTGGLSNFGIALVANTSTTDFAIDSKEATTTSHLAQLDIVLNHAATADSATSVTGTVNASQVNGVLTNAMLAGSNVTGPVSNAVSATTAGIATTVTIPLVVSGTGTVVTANSTGGSNSTGLSGSGTYVGVYGFNSNSLAGVYGQSDTSTGVAGISNTGVGVVGRSGPKGNSSGVLGVSQNGIGVNGQGSIGVYGTGTNLAGQFEGSVTINGNLNVSGTSNLTATDAVHATTADDATNANTANTVTNGVYITGTYANPSWITSLDGSKVTGTVANATNSVNATTAGTVAVPLNLSSTGKIITATSIAGSNVYGVEINNISHNGGGILVTGGSFGVYGETVGNADSPNITIGVHGVTHAANGTGVRGTADNSSSGKGVVGFGTIGVSGETNGTGANNIGVLGFAGNSSSVAIKGINTGGGLAGQFDGPIKINGNVLVESAGQGIVLKSPNGLTCKLLTIDDSGAMTLAPITCP